MNHPTAYLFGPFRLLVVRRELLLHGVPVTLGQRGFEVLLALVARAGQLVTKNEIMDVVWPGVVVEENNLQVHVSALRKILASAGDAQSYLVTVSGRGYRFVAPVELEAPRGDIVPAPPVATDRRQDLSVTIGNLTSALTRFIGRCEELAQVEARLVAGRLVTLTGPGGVGKTRLAMEAAWVLQPRYADGAWLVELAPLQDPKLVGSAIVEALGLQTARDGCVDAIAAVLRTKKLLLILDNCEHVIGEGASVAERLLRACPNLSIIATSREPLAVTGETVLRVPPLKLPAIESGLTAARALQSEALALFSDRAGAVADGWMITDANAAAVVALCQRLDGIPLAIEMAAPRLRVMSIEQLTSGLDARLRLLASESRTIEPRHRTLHAVLDWSYALLSDAEKRLLQRLAVFAGSVNIESITLIAGDADLPDISELLVSLVDKSLVATDLTSSETRYRLAPVTRDYARELVGGGHRGLHWRHAEHFRDRFAAAADEWETMSGARWLDCYGRDLDELRAALGWAFGPEGNPELGIAIVANSHALWSELGSVMEHRAWVDEALLHVDDRTPQYIIARLLSWFLGDVRELDDPTDREEALRAASLHASAGDTFAQGRALLRAGSGGMMDNASDSEALLRQALTLLKPVGATKSLARCLSALASVRLLAGDRADAQTLHRQAVSVSAQLR